VLGSVAYYMDRYGYDVLPLAQSLLAGETLPPRTVTQHILVTAANVFRSCARRRFPPARHQRDRMAYEHATRGFGSPFPLRVNSAVPARQRHGRSTPISGPELERAHLAIRQTPAGRQRVRLAQLTLSDPLHGEQPTADRVVSAE